MIELGYIERRQNIGVRPNEAVRYGIADPAFYQRFIEPATFMLERYPPAEVWADRVESYLDTYMGHEFERIAAEAYVRRSKKLELPLFEEWGRCEGTDHDRQLLEIDLVARISGEVFFREW